MAASVPAPWLPSATAGHVLAIDDSPQIRDLFQAVFEDAGYRVSLRSDPVEPAEVARIGPDVLVLDVRFGGDDRGLDLLHRLRRDSETAGLPVVLCSAAVETIRRIDRSLVGDGVGLVVKPFDLDELLAEVDRVQERARRGTTGAGGPGADGRP